ncbi:MAG TPA: Crp/Fnr family transcriptional regulator [Mycobacteriales bacterium]|nr:Crp/Fnr family transcriptional regulator [Mycobacteriales bacterium]
MRWSILEGLTSAQQAELLRLARRRSFKRSEVIFHEGDPADAVHLIESGHVSVRVGTPYGETATLRLLGPGDLFGELAVISPGPRNATITAIEGCETLVLHRDQIDQLRRENPAVERALLESVIQEVRRLSSQIVEAMYFPAATRLARRLVELADAWPVDPHGHTTVPLTQGDLAGLCGTTRPTVNQLLGRLVEQGLVELRRGKVIICDVAGLIERADL